MTEQLPLTLPYSQRDTDSILATMKTQLTAAYPEWTDFLESDIGYMILKASVGLYDFNAFFTDQNVAETFLSLCQLRESAVRRAKELNYVPQEVQPAVCTAVITFPIQTSELDIDANSVWNVNGVSFTCLNSITLPTGQTQLTITLTQGTPYSLTVTGTGTPWFKVVIPDNACNIAVSVNGTPWTQVDSWIDVNVPTSYKIYEDTTGQTICFGANINTNMPQSGDTIVVTALLSDGASGNNNASGVNVTAATAIRNTLNVQLNNAISGVTSTAALGGADVESLQSIKNNAPAFYGTQGRVVTIADYEAIVNGVSGVVDSACIGGENLPGTGFYRYVYITVMGTDPTSVSPDLLTAVKNALINVNIVPIIPNVEAPAIVNVNMDVEIGLSSNSFTNASTARNDVSNVITTFFKPESLGGQQGIGDNFYNSALVAAIMAIGGITYVDLSFTLTSSATSQAGVITIPLPSNADLTNCTLTDASDTVLFSGDGSQYFAGKNFTYAQADLSDQLCTLTYACASLYGSKTIDILNQYNQINLLTDLSISSTFS